MKKLLEGVQKFRTRVFRRHHEWFAQLARGQSPEVLFITCSDSRIGPNLITQTSPGELFVLRNAGNIVPPHGSGNGGEAATIEYAVDKLGVKHIVVCGHSDCGAMRALLDPSCLGEASSIRKWLSHADAVRRMVGDTCAEASHEERLRAAIEENVLLQIDHLRMHPPVRAALARGALSLHAWVYQLETGDVYECARGAGRFTPAAEDAPAAEAYRASARPRAA